MKLSELFLRPILDLPGKPEHSPLTAGWVFEDAQLLDVRVDVLHSTVGALFEIRPSHLPTELDIVSLNCGAMMFRQTTEVSWTRDTQQDSLNPEVWPVNECQVEVSATGVKVKPLGEINGMSLLIVAGSVEFYAGRLPSLPDDIPSYPEHIDVTGLVPAWEMDFSPTNVWTLAPIVSQKLKLLQGFSAEYPNFTSAPWKQAPR